MRRISAHSGQLHWTQPDFFRREHELRSGSELIATLRFHGMFSSLATAESADGSWTFKRLGWCGSRATIRELGQTVNLAEFRKYGWGGSGELMFPNGRTFKAAPNFWLSRFQIASESDQPVVQIRSTGFLCAAGDVEIVAGELPELPLLILFGWHLFVLQIQDSGAAVATSA